MPELINFFPDKRYRTLRTLIKRLETKPYPKEGLFALKGDINEAIDFRNDQRRVIYCLTAAAEVAYLMYCRATAEYPTHKLYIGYCRMTFRYLAALVAKTNNTDNFIK